MKDGAPTRERKEKKCILFVCCGNRERSVIAERLLQQRLRDNYPQIMDRVTIGSAGIFPQSYLKFAEEQGVIFEYPYFGKTPNQYAVEYLAQKGGDWIWPDGYPAEFISDIEQCLSISMERFVDYIK